MKSVTVIAPMFRPGGWDLLMFGLMRQTYPHFDVIVPDERYAKRHEQVVAYVSRLEFQRPLYHVPLHRRTGPWNHPATAINTGLSLATGEIVLLLVDYAYVPPDWIEKHVEAHLSPRLVMGRHRYIPEPLLRGGPYRHYSVMTAGHKWEAIHQRELHASECEISMLAEEFREPGIMHVQGFVHGPSAPGPHDHLSFYAKNDSFPLRAALDANGMDERELSSHDFGRRLIQNGLKGWALPESEVIAFELGSVFPHISGILFGEPSVESEESPRTPNPFEIYDLRKKMWAWRGLSLQSEPVLRSWTAETPREADL
jgi:hypothetical protein